MLRKLRKLHEIKEPRKETSRIEDILERAQWYQEKCPEAALIIYKSFPVIPKEKYESRVALIAHRAAVDIMMSDHYRSNCNRSTYLYDLTIATFKIASQTKDKKDITQAKRLVTELSGKSGFDLEDIETIQDLDQLKDHLIAQQAKKLAVLEQEMALLKKGKSESSSSSSVVSGPALMLPLATITSSGASSNITNNVASSVSHTSNGFLAPTLTNH